MKKQSTAVELLRELMQKRAWYKGSEITRKDAWYYKNADISEATASEALKKLGWVQVKPPTWEKVK